MTRITSHVLDTSTGRPASGIAVRLERPDAADALALASATTDRDGRLGDWLPEGVPAGKYRLVFETGAWFRAAERESLYHRVVNDFEDREGVPHYHLPLLLAPFGYSTYRGS
jgi:5-hydroxyisourate hydrolase